jgi:hypothetical protein
VKAARLSWFGRQRDLDPDKLVFLNETATNTKMVRRYGRAPRGERCRIAVPFGHWKTITVTAGLRTSGLMATALFDGPMTGARFRGYVEETLVPALRPGDTVVLDNLPAPCSSGRRASDPCHRIGRLFLGAGGILVLNTVAAGCMWAVARRDVGPGCARAQPPKDAIQYPPVVHALFAVHVRQQQRFDHRPLRFRQIKPRH